MWGLLNTFHRGPSLSAVFFRGVFCSPAVQPLYLAAHLRASGQISWRSADRSAVMMREQTRGERWGGGGWRRWGESERWKWRMEGGGEDRGAVLQILGGRGPHTTSALSSVPPPCPVPPPPPLLCHSGLDYFILIRLIPPGGKLLITSLPLLQRRAISFQREDGMRARARSASRDRKMWKVRLRRGLDSSCGSAGRSGSSQVWYPCRWNTFGPDSSSSL